MLGWSKEEKDPLHRTASRNIGQKGGVGNTWTQCDHERHDQPAYTLSFVNMEEEDKHKDGNRNCANAVKNNLEKVGVVVGLDHWE